MPVTPFSTIKNNIATLTNAGITAGDTQVQVVAGAGALFPAASFYVSCEFEVLRCTARVGDILTVIRGVDGSLAASHPGGSIIEMRTNAGLFSEVQAAINAVESGSNQVPFNPPNGSITNAMLGPDVPKPSLLQNGGLEQWHRGPGPFNVSINGYPDNWILDINGTDTFNVSRDSVNADVSSAYCASCVFVLGSGAGRTSLLTSTQSPLSDGLVLADLIGRQVTLSLRVKCSVANAVRAFVNDYYSATVHYTYSPYHTGNGLYQTLTLTFTPNVADTIIQVGLAFSATCTAYIDNVTLVPGPIGASYVPIPIPDIVPNIRIGTDVARANLLTNGGFEIWQRGNGPFSANGAIGPDRWQLNINGTDTLSVSKATAGNGSPASANCMQCVYAVGNTASSNVAQIWKQSDTPLTLTQFSFSARVYSTVPNGVRLGLNDSVQLLYSPYHPGDGTWRTLTVTILTNNASVFMTIAAYFNASGTYYIDNASFTTGVIAQDFVPLHPAEDIARCLRYYEVLGDATNSYVQAGYNAAGSADYRWHTYKSRKAIMPSVTKNGTWGVSNCNQPIPGGYSSLDGFSINFTVIGVGGWFAAVNTAGMNFTIEANP